MNVTFQIEDGHVDRLTFYYPFARTLQEAIDLIDDSTHLSTIKYIDKHQQPGAEISDKRQSIQIVN